MGIRVGNFKVVYDSITMEAINPEYLTITKEEIMEYVKNKPMPDDPEYSLEDMIGDITDSIGFYTLPKKIKKETANFVATMLNDLILNRGSNQ